MSSARCHASVVAAFTVRQASRADAFQALLNRLAREGIERQRCQVLAEQTRAQHETAVLLLPPPPALPPHAELPTLPPPPNLLDPPSTLPPSKLLPQAELPLLHPEVSMPPREVPPRNVLPPRSSPVVVQQGSADAPWPMRMHASEQILSPDVRRQTEPLQQSPKELPVLLQQVRPPWPPKDDCSVALLQPPLTQQDAQRQSVSVGAVKSQSGDGLPCQPMPPLRNIQPSAPLAISQARPFSGLLSVNSLRPWPASAEQSLPGCASSSPAAACHPSEPCTGSPPPPSTGERAAHMVAAAEAAAAAPALVAIERGGNPSAGVCTHSAETPSHVPAQADFSAAVPAISHADPHSTAGVAMRAYRICQHLACPGPAVPVSAKQSNLQSALMQAAPDSAPDDVTCFAPLDESSRAATAPAESRVSANACGLSRPAGTTGSISFADVTAAVGEAYRTQVCDCSCAVSLLLDLKDCPQFLRLPLSHQEAAVCMSN